MPLPALPRLVPLPTILLEALCLASLCLASLRAQEPEPPTPPAAEATEAGEPPQDGDAPAAAKKPEKPGIPVTDTLVQSFCGRCHVRDGRDHMTRISYVRKSPEGWAQSIKRMGRLHGLQLTPDAARSLVRSLSNSHGLARSEAEKALYESERRVHWSEEHHDEDFKRACAQCHPLGRALLQYRDQEEWQLLRATHVAMFPLSRRQIGGGPPEDESRRQGPPPEVAAAIAASQEGGARRRGGAPGGSAGGAGSPGPGGGSREGVGDRVLSKLSQDQPLFTDAWEKWTQNRREVPLAGTWTAHGHETGRGDVIGTVELTRTAEDEYDVRWRLAWSDGTRAERTGKGILYAGYSWRGRAKADGEDLEWREVLLLDDTWQQLKGRLFAGNYDELGVDVTLVRDQGRPRVIAIDKPAVSVPSTGFGFHVHGEAFPADLKPSDFFCGEGVTVTSVERVDARTAALVVDVAPGAVLGRRTVAYGPNPGGAELVLYDTVDYVRIRPLQGLSRVGGAKLPNQIERFEAYAVHRGKDEKPYTDDDVDLFQVRPKWALAEFHVREDDDDLQYVGTIDPVTGVFTPNVDGPNPARKWQANNVGDVFVTCEVDLTVPVRPEPPKKDQAKDGDKPAAGEASAAQPEAPAPRPVVRETRTFRARSHLLVTVPLYSRWQVLEWEDR